MNIIDSSGWLEYFIGGENASFFAPAIEDPENVIVPTISLFEVFKRVLIEKDRNDALEAIALMKEGRVVDLDDSLALVSAELSHELRLPMADSFVLNRFAASIEGRKTRLWFFRTRPSRL